MHAQRPASPVRRRALGQWRTFLREFRDSFATTGAVLPSSRYLARSIAKLDADLPPRARLLEAGPGTGAFTDEMIRQLRPGDELVLVEINQRFVHVLEERLREDPAWSPKRDQVRLVHGSIEDLPSEERFHAIVCGLPFNNFPPDLVETLVGRLVEALEPGGTFRFFEYLWIRTLSSPFVGSTKRDHQRSVAERLGRFLQDYGVGRQQVILNIPPAVVHRLCRDRAGVG
ncbi:16S ribosomal RNA methyltransferase KsgA/Dim1 family protein [Planctomycetes bacterium Pan216]|uniref:16S ribosomal RNA methyltransferase KsgA/Dim1 family protein n=1 Tax=Kolteria novifilia TaxID=2527975 RepID=A0A518B2A2_9BACT|nr:16S ribosomal RNA methyltransferase KsgA/Dim1 family protein [Planctomycetes bacterium Pan216]